MLPATANYIARLGKGLEINDLRIVTDGLKSTLHVRTIAPLEPEDFDALLPYFPKGAQLLVINKYRSGLKFTQHEFTVEVK